jgi:hypothetical protein
MVPERPGFAEPTSLKDRPWINESAVTSQVTVVPTAA